MNNLDINAKRLDALEKVTGSIKYTEDLKIPGMLHGIAVYPRISSGKIKKIDIRASLDIKGIEGIMLANDVPGRNSLGPEKLSHPIISDEVNYTGDAIALIAADSEESARNAASLIKVDYEETDGIFSIEKALEREDLVFNTIKHSVGNLSEGFKQADVVIDGTYNTPCIDHAYLECESALAVPEPDGRITIYCGCQEPYHLPTVVSKVLNCKREKIHFIGTALGGAFGGKGDTSFIVASRAALLAWYCKKPVLFTVSREESFRSSAKRSAASLYYRIGANKQGYITALESRIYINKGAYLGLGGKVPPTFNRIYWHFTGPYSIPNASLDLYMLRTNNPCGGQMRSPGVPKVCFAVESIIDQLAEKLKMDPIEFRLKNGLEAGMTTANGVYLKDSVGIKKTLQEAKRFLNTCNEQDVSGKKDLKVARGIGVASSWHGISYGNEKDTSEARIFLQHDGKLLIRTGLVELGQGLLTVLTNVASVEMGLPVEMIELASPNSDTDPDSKNTTSSRATVVGSLAIRLAAQEAINNLIKLAARYGGIDENELYWENGAVYAKNDKWNIDLATIATNAGSERPLLIGNGKWQAQKGQHGYTTYGYATHVAEIEVDKETGFLKINKLFVAQDVGAVLNKQGLEGQAVGSAIMASGFGAFERIILEQGKLLNPSFHDYRLPLFPDTPEVKCSFVEEPCSEYVFGAKGAGEPSVVPTAAAIANAFYNATGIRVNELPITQEIMTENKFKLTGI